MTGYWYVSIGKLRAPGALDSGLAGRLRSTARVGLPGASVEVGLDAATAKSLNRAVESADKQIRRKKAVRPVAEFGSGAPPANYFHSQGPSCRPVIDGMLWIGQLVDDSAGLVVGSAANGYGRISASAAEPPFSPTVDPVGAVRNLLDHPRAAASSGTPKTARSCTRGKC